MPLFNKIKQANAVLPDLELFKNPEKVKDLEKYRAKEIEKTTRKLYVDDHKRLKDKCEQDRDVFIKTGLVLAFITFGFLIIYGILTHSFTTSLTKASPFLCLGGLVLSGVAIRDSYDRRIKFKKITKKYEQIKQSNDCFLVKKYRKQATEIVDQKIKKYQKLDNKT